LVFQCRVNPRSVGEARPETSLNNEVSKRTVVIDANFSNRELEWIIPAETAEIEFIQENIICYGMMIRISEGDPKDLPSSKWWIHALHRDHPYESL
jgi:hypothetical protein